MQGHRTVMREPLVGRNQQAVFPRRHLPQGVILHPLIWGTTNITDVRTSWSGSSHRRGRGTHSSSSMRMSNQHLFGEFKRRDGLLAAHTRKMV